jgi:arylsulfatase A
MNRICLVFLTLLVVSPMFSLSCTQTRRPNIIFILADDLGYGDLGSYGQTLIKTPNLDRMAKEGLRFTDFYAGCAVCAPSRCSLMTGLHTGHSYIRTNSTPPDQPLRPEDLTVAEVLKNTGYATGVIGKWGLGAISSTGSPNKQGFDYFFGFDEHSAGEYFPTTICQNERLVSVSPGAYQQDLFMSETWSFIRTNKDRPFFLYLAPMIPHAPYEIPSMGRYKHQPWSENDRRFAAMITYLDTGVGQLFDLLRTLGLDSNTIVFFSSDNGPEGETIFKSAGPLNGIKRTLYEGGIREPLIVWGPGHISPGTTSTPFAFWDFLKTAAELGAVDFTQGDGLSFLPTLLGQAQESRPLYWEFEIKNGKGFVQAVRMGRWKAIYTTSRTDTAFELYNLDSDIGETHDLATQQPDVVKEIKSIMKKEHIEPIQ